jgi:AraC-like DNA-binding protein
MQPALLEDIYPCAILQDYVRKYQVFKFSFEKNVIPPVKFHAPRPEHSITFYVRDSQKFSQGDSETIITYPPCVINGIYTIPLHRYGGYDFLAIKVVLQPTTLSRLKIIQANELTNHFINAEDFIGKEVSFVCEQLIMMNELKDMIVAIESFLIHLTSKSNKKSEPIDEVCRYILKQNGNIPLDWLASQSCLSIRQFIRKFEEKVGVSPKMFQKIIRFDTAFRLKNNYPGLDWLSIALDCGYYDYQHLVKDFQEFTNLTPPAFYEVEKASPERKFALHEG